MKEVVMEKNSIVVGLLVIALIASTTPPVRAEPITLTVMAITGITTVAFLVATDVAVHKEDANRAAFKNDGNDETKKQAADVKPNRTSSEKAQQPVVR
jgi:uncharacterized protein YacL